MARASIGSDPDMKKIIKPQGGASSNGKSACKILVIIAAISCISACGTSKRLDIRDIAYKEFLFKLTYEYLRTSECRRAEDQRAYEVCGKSYYRDYAYYQKIRRDFIAHSSNQPW